MSSAGMKWPFDQSLGTRRAREPRRRAREPRKGERPESQEKQIGPESREDGPEAVVAASEPAKKMMIPGEAVYEG